MHLVQLFSSRQAHLISKHKISFLMTATMRRRKTRMTKISSRSFFLRTLTMKTKHKYLKTS